MSSPIAGPRAGRAPVENGFNVIYSPYRSLASVDCSWQQILHLCPESARSMVPQSKRRGMIVSPVNYDYGRVDRRANVLSGDEA